MNRLLYVFLRGAADGLNMAVPPDSEYDAARPTLALPDDRRLDIGDGWALHAVLERTASRFRDGQVALIPAVRMIDADRSHFESQELLETGGRTGTGWIGRCLAQTPSPEPRPFRAVSVGSPSIPSSFRGSNDVIGSTSLDDLRVRTGSDRIAVDPAWFGRVWAGAVDGPASAGAIAALGVQDQVSAAQRAPSARERGFDGTEAGRAFAEVDRVWASDLNTEVVMVNLFRWDTHDQQDPKGKGIFSQMLGDLDRSLDTLMTRQDSADNPITVLIVTEFGRRLAENASQGTDHGSGSLAIAMGRNVVGGFHGEWPGLANLVDGDVRPVNPMEAVLAEVAEKVLGADVEQALPAAAGVARLGLLR